MHGAPALRGPSIYNSHNNNNDTFSLSTLKAFDREGNTRCVLVENDMKQTSEGASFVGV